MKLSGSMKKHLFSLRMAIISPLTLGFVLIILVVIGVQNQSYKRTLTEATNKQLVSIGEAVLSDINTYMVSPLRVALSLGNSIQFMLNNGVDEKTFIDNFFIFSYQNIGNHILQIDGASFSDSNGDNYSGMIRTDDSKLLFMTKNKETNYDLYIYNGPNKDNELLGIMPNYEPTQRPWFIDLKLEDKAKWTLPYLSPMNKLYISVLAPLQLKNNDKGIISIQIRLETIAKLLKSSYHRNNASVFIFDNEQKLVATSNSNESLIIDPKTGKDYIPEESFNKSLPSAAERKSIHKINDPIMKAAAKAWFEASQAGLTSHIIEFYINKKRYIGYINNFKNNYRVDWTIITSLSEEELVGNLAQEQQKELIIILLSSLTIAGLIYLILHRITNRIQNAAKVAQNLSLGAHKMLLEESTFQEPDTSQIKEINTLNHSFNHMAKQLQSSFKTLKEQVTYDQLTSLYNRRGLIEKYKTLTNAPMGTVIMLEIEKFNYINDSLGYDKANLVLIEFAKRLKEGAPTDSLIGRIGDELFTIYIPVLTEHSKVRSIIHELIKSLGAVINIGNEAIFLTQFISVANLSIIEDIEQALRNASIALSLAKHKEEKYLVYTPDMADASRKRTNIISQMKYGLAHGEFIPFYQPLIDLHSNQIVGAEALARWRSPERGITPPNDFIPLAEECGLINDIGQQILYQACLDTKTSIDIGFWPQNFRIHVNVSVKQLLLDEFADMLHQVLNETGLSTSNLTLEITESNIATDHEIMKKNLALIRQLGIGIAIDDFGTGYSSLAYLQDMEFDSLKIDRSFINRLEEESADKSLVASILTMTRNFDIYVVSEGIETQEQAEILKKLNCHLAQGYYFSRPVPLDEWPEKPLIIEQLRGT